MVELRKRKTPSQPPTTAKKSRPDQASSTASKTTTQQENFTSPSSALVIPKAGDTIDLDGFGGEIDTNDGVKTTLKKLVDESKSGVVLFTYPRASTPGCTKQACMFRDEYGHLTSTGLSIFGLSADSPKANTTFKTKQNLPYPLLCDTSSTLIAAIGLKKLPKGITRGVFVINKDGTILLLRAGSPGSTVEAVQGLVDTIVKDSHSDTA